MSPIHLTASQLTPAARTLAKAFEDDPLLVYLLPRAADRARLVARCCAGVVRYGILYGEVYSSSPDLAGIAVWLPPESVSPSLWKLGRAGILFLPLSAGAGFLRRFWGFHLHIGSCWRRLLPQPHWHLQMLGVDPSRQRQGQARILLEEKLAKLDPAAAPCSLETGNEKNIGFYERFGFRLLETTTIPGSDVPCWLMARMPSGVSEIHSARQAPPPN